MSSRPLEVKLSTHSFSSDCGVARAQRCRALAATDDKVVEHARPPSVIIRLIKHAID